MNLKRGFFLLIGAFALMGCAVSNASQIPSPEVSNNEISGPVAEVADPVYVSAYSFEDTVARLKSAIGARNLNIFTEVDHGAGASAIGLSIGNAHLIQFGNPRVGTLLMQKNIEFGLVLPMKALVFEQDQQVKVKMTDIVELARDHGVAPDQPPVSNVAGVLDAIATEATQ